ncbi:MAG: pyridoxamine kinase [Eubacteriales bacterium]|nr:pyridoxamine kinase [Eubacteriales bacterium]
MKRVVSIQDISGLGRCSLTVALPVISAMGVECAIVPTAVLSTHTMFQNFTCVDLTDQILPIAAHWKSQQIHFDAIYTGYLASKEQVGDVLTFFDEMRSDDTLLFVDPAMADHGKLYPAFGPDFPGEMAKVVARADVTVPNITEACLLTGSEYREKYDEAYIKELLEKLVALGAKKAILTGVSFDENKLGVMGYDGSRYFSYFNDKAPMSYHGTGDIFSATAVGGLMRGMTMEEALQLAVDYTLQCIRVTRSDPNATWYGVEFEKAIPLLCERLKDR